MAVVLVFTGVFFAFFNNNELPEDVKIQQQIEQETKKLEQLGLVSDENGEYQINSFDDFISFRDSVNEENITYLNKSVILNTNLDFAGKTYQPIGLTTAGMFQGTFYGNNHTISNVSIQTNNPDEEFALGLFGFVSYATIYDLFASINLIELNDGCFGGGIVGCAIDGCTISNCFVVGRNADSKICVQKKGYTNCAIGGIVGLASSQGSNIDIYRCANLATVSNGCTNSCWVGGIIGYADAFDENSQRQIGTINITECYNGGVVSDMASDGKSYALESFIGGIAGQITIGVTISNCHNNGKITMSEWGNNNREQSEDCGSGTFYNGDFDYENNKTYSYDTHNSNYGIDWAYYVDIQSNVNALNVGAICGYSSGTISNCMNTTTQSGRDYYTYVRVTYMYANQPLSTFKQNDFKWYGDLAFFDFSLKTASCKSVSNGPGVIENCRSFVLYNSIGGWDNDYNVYVLPPISSSLATMDETKNYLKYIKINPVSPYVDPNSCTVTVQSNVFAQYVHQDWTGYRLTTNDNFINEFSIDNPFMSVLLRDSKDDKYGVINNKQKVFMEKSAFGYAITGEGLNTIGITHDVAYWLYEEIWYLGTLWAKTQNTALYYSYTIPERTPTTPDWKVASPARSIPSGFDNTVWGLSSEINSNYPHLKWLYWQGEGNYRPPQ